MVFVLRLGARNDGVSDFYRGIVEDLEHVVSVGLEDAYCPRYGAELACEYAGSVVEAHTVAVLVRFDHFCLTFDAAIKNAASFCRKREICEHAKHVTIVHFDARHHYGVFTVLGGGFCIFLFNITYLGQSFGGFFELLC